MRYFRVKSRIIAYICLWVAVGLAGSFLCSGGYIFASEEVKTPYEANRALTGGTTEAKIGLFEGKNTLKRANISADGISVLYGSNTDAKGYSNLTDEDKNLLMKIASAEAGSESTKGKAVIMQVVLNRTESEIFPNTIKEVIFQSGQFSTINDGNYSRAKPDEDCEIALQEVLNGNHKDFEALFFDSCKNSWASRNREFLCKIGNHKFYK